MAARANQIYIGSLTTPTYYFENKSILKVEAETAVALAGEELSIDTFTPTVLYEHIDPMVFKPTDKDGIKTSDSKVMRSKTNTDIRTLPYATPVWWYNGGDLMGKYYIKNVERTARTQYKLNCISAIGLLDKMKHFGGVYSGATFESVLKDILAPSKILHRIPYEYQEVEYLEANGSQYINTGLKMSSGMLTEVSFVATERSSLQMIFGETHATDNKSYGFGISSTNHKANYYFGDYTASVVSGDPVVPINTKSVVKFNTAYDSSTKGYTIDGTKYPISPDYNFQDSTNYLFIFGVNYNGAFSSPFYGKIYYLKITSNDNKLHEYIPCYRKSDNEAGFYDMLSKTFYNNSGTGAFTVGPIVGEADTGSVMEYVLDDSLSSQTVYGYLPYATKRENLYKLMFAYNVTMIKTDAGVPYFTRIYGETVDEIPKADIYNSGSIDYGTPVSKVELTEHTYTYSDGESEEIYNNSDNTSIPNRELVEFGSAPVYIPSIASTGNIVLHYYNENCAIISGLGTITGVPYKHTELLISRENEEEVEENIMSVTDDTLLSSVNGDASLNRTFLYYTQAKEISNAINVKGEHCGRRYTITDPFMDTQTAFLKKMSMNSSGILKASSTMVMDYYPTGLGGIYEHCVVLTGSGTWTTPTEAITSGRIRIVLIGGGSGGYAGKHGEDGSDGQNCQEFVSHVGTLPDSLISSSASLPSYNTGGAGGEGGAAGEGGKVFQTTINSPASSYSYSCGTGGTGGTAEIWTYTAGSGHSIATAEVDPTDGTDTTFGSYTTSGSAKLSSGVMNYSNGEIYALDGIAGTAGGDGGSIGTDDGYSDYGENVSYNGVMYKGGSPGAHGFSSYLMSDCSKGSGAVVGHNGNDGWSSVNFGDLYLEEYGTYLVEGDVGIGGSAEIPVAADAPKRYGQGGNGGHGGGGGGATASVGWSANIFPTRLGIHGGWGGDGTDVTSTYMGGKGSRGSAGSKGGDGCVLIYY